jgi:hypothetical protein
MENRKRAKVHMLPTDKAENCIIKFNSGGAMEYHRQYFTQEYLRTASRSAKSFHLYITTDEGVMLEINDWVITTLNGESYVEQLTPTWKNLLGSTRLKIIASTDPKLIKCSCRIENGDKIEYFIEPCDKNCFNKIPQPSQDFIKAYCEQGGIDEVDVEYTKFTNSIPECDYDPTMGICSVCSDVADCIHDTYTYKLKLNPDNTIIIHPVEEKMYSLEEICKASMYFAYTSHQWTETEIEAWVKAVDFDEMD